MEPGDAYRDPIPCFGDPMEICDISQAFHDFNLKQSLAMILIRHFDVLRPNPKGKRRLPVEWKFRLALPC